MHLSVDLGRANSDASGVKHRVAPPRDNNASVLRYLETHTNENKISSREGCAKTAHDWALNYCRGFTKVCVAIERFFRDGLVCQSDLLLARTYLDEVSMRPHVLSLESLEIRRPVFGTIRVAPEAHRHGRKRCSAEYVLIGISRSGRLTRYKIRW